MFDFYQFSVSFFGSFVEKAAVLCSTSPQTGFIFSSQCISLSDMIMHVHFRICLLSGPSIQGKLIQVGTSLVLCTSLSQNQISARKRVNSINIVEYNE